MNKLLKLYLIAILLTFSYCLQVKCPECRAEHRIPYNGVQAFPTNVTLQRFLELHIEITGELPDPTSGKLSASTANHKLLPLWQLNEYSLAKINKVFNGISLLHIQF